MPLPWWQTLAVFAYALVACLVVNDALKVAMIRWRVPYAVPVEAVDGPPRNRRKQRSGLCWRSTRVIGSIATGRDMTR